MTDLVKRLRERDAGDMMYFAPDTLCVEAADRIEHLERELALERHKFTESEKTWMSVAQHANDHADAAIADLAAEKGLADRLYKSSRIYRARAGEQGNDEFLDSHTDYRKARGL